MRNRTAPQANRATPCVLGSLMRGTLMAREMPESARTPSTAVRRAGTIIERRGEGVLFFLTHGSDNLRLEAVLVLEARRKVGDAAAAVARDIRDVPDLVEHVAAGEEQDGDQGDGSPDGAALDDGQDVGPGGVRGGDGSGQQDQG